MWTTASKSDLKVKISFWGWFGWGEQYFFLTSATSCSWYCLSYTLVACQHFLSTTPSLTGLKRLMVSSLNLDFHLCNSIWQSHNYRCWRQLCFLPLFPGVDWYKSDVHISTVSMNPCLYVLMYLFTKMGFSFPALFTAQWKMLHVLSYENKYPCT